MFSHSDDGGTKLVLHVGCGDPDPQKLHPAFRPPMWREVRLDIDPAVEPDIVASMTDMPIVENGSVDAIWSSHNLEHLYAHEVPIALAEFRRVLKPDGLALITLPDLQKVAEFIAAGKLEEAAYTSPAGPIAPIDIVYGYRPSIAQGNAFMAHRTGFVARSLGKALARASFETIAIQRDGFDLWALAYCAEQPAEITRSTVRLRDQLPSAPVRSPAATSSAPTVPANDTYGDAPRPVPDKEVPATSPVPLFWPDTLDCFRWSELLRRGP
jgi:SAM-dependent methyltransferase